MFNRETVAGVMFDEWSFLRTRLAKNHGRAGTAAQLSNAALGALATPMNTLAVVSLYGLGRSREYLLYQLNNCAAAKENEK